MCSSLVLCLTFKLFALVSGRAFSSVSVNETVEDVEITIETVVLLDKELSEEFSYNPFARFKYCDTFKQVQEILDTVRRDGINIKIKLNGLKLLDELDDQRIFGNNTEIIDNQTVFLIGRRNFRTYAAFLQNQTWVKEYDISLLLTRKPMGTLLGRKGRISGFAIFPGACSKHRYGVANNEVRAIAIQIGSLLGADYDESHIGERCYDERGGYIMSSRPIEPSRFSKCSILAFREYLRRNITECLRVTNSEDTVGCEETLSRFPGQG